MQKRTRIFAAITVAIGLLLGLAMFATTFFSTAVPAGASAQKHRHTKTHVTTVTSTVTSTTTSTTTSTPLPPPGPTCFSFPNPAPIGSGTPGSANPAGNVQFVVQCVRLDPNDLYSVSWNFPTCAFGTLVVDNFAQTFIPNTGTIFNARPDANGVLNANFQFAGCRPGTGTVTITDQRTGAVILIPVTLAAPGTTAKK